jgi:hypothetical protein
MAVGLAPFGGCFCFADYNGRFHVCDRGDVVMYQERPHLCGITWQSHQIYLMV